MAPGRRVDVHCRVRAGSFCPRAIRVNGVPCGAERRESNPDRPGGMIIARAEIQTRLKEAGNLIEIEL
jgi:hypothetical protein